MWMTKPGIHLIKHPFLWLLFSFVLAAGCSRSPAGPVPQDFSFLLDVGSARPDTVQNINIHIDAAGEGYYEYYDTGGVIQYDSNGIVQYDPSQVTQEGNFQVSRADLQRLWTAIEANQFFALTDDYHMAMGTSYAFISIQAEGKKHTVDNIGMDVPEIGALVKTVQEILPEGVDIEYGRENVFQQLQGE